MKDARQVEEEVWIGKTIERVRLDSDRLLLRFADGTFSVLRLRRNCNDEDASHWLSLECDAGPRDLYDLGLIDYHTCNALLKAENEARWAEDLARERREYERLRAKFEPSGPG